MKITQITNSIANPIYIDSDSNLIFNGVKLLNLRQATSPQSILQDPTKQLGKLVITKEVLNNIFTNGVVGVPLFHVFGHTDEIIPILLNDQLVSGTKIIHRCFQYNQDTLQILLTVIVPKIQLWKVMESEGYNNWYKSPNNFKSISSEYFGFTIKTTPSNGNQTIKNDLIQLGYSLSSLLPKLTEMYNRIKDIPETSKFIFRGVQSSNALDFESSVDIVEEKEEVVSDLTIDAQAGCRPEVINDSSTRDTATIQVSGTSNAEDITVTQFETKKTAIQNCTPGSRLLIITKIQLREEVRYQSFYYVIPENKGDEINILTEKYTFMMTSTTQAIISVELSCDGISFYSNDNVSDIFIKSVKLLK